MVKIYFRHHACTMGLNQISHVCTSFLTSESLKAFQKHFKSSFQWAVAWEREREREESSQEKQL
jgi:hypothetical protein